MKKTLENYFDDWILVFIPITSTYDYDNKEKADWCLKNIGIRSLKWDCKWVKVEPGTRGRLAQNVWHWMFRSDADALMFIMTFGGNIVNKHRHNN